MPVLEAIPDESQTMRYKLVTMQDNDGIKRLPIIRGVGLENASMTLNFDDSVQARPIKPETIAYKVGSGISGAQFDATAGYTLFLFDEEAATVTVEGKVPASRDITDFNKNVNSKRLKDIEKYQQYINEGINIGLPLYITSDCIKFLGEDEDSTNNKAFILDGSRRLMANIFNGINPNILIMVLKKNNE